MNPGSCLLARTMIALALISIHGLAQTIYTPYTFTTLAGLAGTWGSADGTGSAARFSSPRGVAVDSVGNIYVADSSNNTIRKVTPAGIVTTLAGQAGWGWSDGTGPAARFGYPTGVAVDSAGNVYVADFGNHAIRKVTPAGVVTTLAGLYQCCGPLGTTIGGYADGMGSDARFRSPSDVAVDSAGNVYVADSGNYTIRKVTPAGLATTMAGQAGSAGSADGTGSAARFNSLSGIAVDSAGNVYVADSGNHTIRKVTPGGVVTTLAGLAESDAYGRPIDGFADGTGKAARFSGPGGVAVDSAGNVYVTDSSNVGAFSNNTVRKVTPAGVVTTMAGRVSSFGSTDGTGPDALFFAPAGIAVDSAGNVYVTDSSRNTIRKGFPAQVPASIAISAPGFGINSGQFGFTLTGPMGQPVVVEASIDLVNWLPIWTNTFAGALHFSAPQSGVYASCFYRAHTP